MSKIFVADKLKIQGTKTLSTIALILILTASAIMAAMPAANAHSPPWTIPTYAYLTVNPNPVGVGQAAFVNFWLDKVAPTANSQYGDRWQNFTVTITKPDGTTTTLGPFGSDDVGGAFTTFTPTAIGTYTFVFNFPGQTIAGANPSPITGTTNAQQVGDIYLPSTSNKVTLAVQQTQIQGLPEAPLPTGYWQRPIQAVNSAWYVLGGNWLRFGTRLSTYNASNCFNPYTTAPNTAHILWTKPESAGGLIGGEFGGNEVNSNYYSTSQYEPKFMPVIINGVLYYQQLPGSMTTPAGWVAVDIRTGQTIWTLNTSVSLTTGQIMDFVSPNQFGGIPYLWSTEPTVAPNTGTTYGMYDAMTGKWILDVVNGTGVTFAEAADGSLLGYYINSTSMTLNMWNSSRAIMTYSLVTRQNTNSFSWRPAQGGMIPWSMGLEWSVPMVTTMAASNGTTVNINAAYAEAAGVSSPLSISKIASGVILVNDLPGPTIAFQQPGYVVEEGYSATTGQLLWGPLNQTQTPWCKLTLDGAGEYAAGNGVYIIYNCESLTFVGYSLQTGQQLWGPVGPYSNVWGYYGIKYDVAYGNFYTYDMGGHLNCFDLKTGKHLWDFFTGTGGYETPYGDWPFWIFDVGTIADGKIYIGGGHEYSPPLFHGCQLWCVNATSGQLLWSILSFPVTSPPAIADGYILSLNAYDNQIYCYGQGQSATTVTANPKVSASGSSVVIEGTVTDQSPGQTCLGIPAAGTPAIADASMSQWMEYLYEQQPMPTNATGVPVTLTALDPNNNTEVIGTVTSDVNGHFGLMWTPPVPGYYTITATFCGTYSYYGSSAETAIGVSKAPAAQVPIATPVLTATPPPTVVQTSTPSPQVTATPVPAPSNPGIPTTYIIIAIVAIIIVVAAAALALKRRK